MPVTHRRTEHPSHNLHKTPKTDIRASPVGITNATVPHRTARWRSRFKPRSGRWSVPQAKAGVAALCSLVDGDYQLAGAR
jgi:hypothetical protein